MSRKLTSSSAIFTLGRLSLVACLGLLILSPPDIGTTGHSRAAQDQRARIISENAPDVIPDHYIVVFKPATPLNEVLAAAKTVERLGAKIGFTYTSALIGFSARLPPTALQVLRTNPRVDYIEADKKYSFNIIQSNPPTGLDRTSERHLPLDNQFTYSKTGAGVNVYVIDSGIRVTHNEFIGGRALVTPFTGCAGNFDDPVGHGTHVAGTIGGATTGIAKGVTLHSVRVADCSGNPNLSTILGGVNWVTSNAVQPAVANMSLGGTASMALDTAVTNSISSGVTYTIAAGNNSGQNACNYSPGRVPTAITVGAIDPTNDTVASFSNIGPCLTSSRPASAFCRPGTLTIARQTLSAALQWPRRTLPALQRFTWNATRWQPRPAFGQRYTTQTMFRRHRDGLASSMPGQARRMSCCIGAR